MGRDGAMGIKAIKQLHGKTIAQDEDSCVVFGMPNAAIEMNVIDKVLPLERIAEEIGLMVR
jgi:two-component system chemotaxis response regulator CheB